jgi:hypothetical protein
MKNKLFLLKNKIANITIWQAIKWIFIIIVVVYSSRAIGERLFLDVTGTRLNFNISFYHESDGLLKPVLAK